MRLFSCEILTPEKLVYRGLVEHLDIDAESGYSGFYPQHAPIISVLKKGKVKIITEAHGNKVFSIDGGFLYLKKNEIKILTPKAEDQSLPNE
jgi:F-type H+-transporting ATPase subunit epsilon